MINDTFLSRIIDKTFGFRPTGRSFFLFKQTIRALLLLPLLAGGFASQVTAQTPQVLVSNTEESIFVSSQNSRSVRFTTGNHTSGYTLSSIDVHLDSTSGRNTVVTIRTNNSSNQPGAIIVTLINPNSFTDDTLNKFTVPADTTLAANTTYWVNVNDSSSSNMVLSRTRSNSYTGLTGWSIGDKAFWRRTQDDSWTSSTLILLIKLNGYANAAAPANAAGVTITGSPLALTELDATSRKGTYSVVLDADPGTGKSITVTPTSGDLTSVTFTPATLTFTGGSSGNWATPQEVTAMAENDGDVVSEVVTITHLTTSSDPSGDYHQISTGNVTVNVTDAGHGILVTPTSLMLATGDDTDTYTVRLKSDPSGLVNVKASSGNPLIANVSPLQRAFNVGTWKVERSFTVTGKAAGDTTITNAVIGGSNTNYPLGTKGPDVIVTVATPDTTAPTVSLLIRTPSTNAVNSDTLAWQVSFSEDVTNVDGSDFNVAGTTATLAAVAVNGSESVYTVTASGGDLANLNGEVTLTIASGHNIQDLAGNALTNRTPLFNSNTFTVDNTAPTVASIARQSPTVENTNADTLTWRVTFSEAVQNVDSSDFDLAGSVANLVVAAVNGSTTIYDVTASGRGLDSVNASVVLSFASDQGITDLAGNALDTTSPTTNNNTFRVDNRKPTVEIRIFNSISSTGGTFLVDIDGNEDLLGLTPDEVIVSNGSASSSWVYADGDVYEIRITPTNPGAVTVKVNADSATDAAGNGNVVSNTFSINYVRPTLTVAPTDVAAASLNGATLTLTPRTASFFGINDPADRFIAKFINEEDLVSNSVPSSKVRLSSTALASITLSGAPSGLTVSAGRLLARQRRHRSVEIDLSYTGAAISVDDPVTVNVGSTLLRYGTEVNAFPPNLSADFTIKAPEASAVPVVTISGGADVTEGSNAAFTLTATPAPTSALTVQIQVADDDTSDFVSSSNEGTKTVTIPTGGTAVYNVATEADSTDEANGEVTVTVLADTESTATYTAGNPAMDTVTVNDDDNGAPTVANLIPDQTATVGASFSYIVPANTFADPDNDALTYSSNAADISWLSFNATTRTFSGTAQGTGGTVSVDVTASDGTLSVRDTFTISVTDNVAPRIASITRLTPASSPTSADSLTWRVIFNEPVTGVDHTDFSVTGTGVGSPTLTVSPAQGGATYDVKATGGNLASLNATVTLSIGSSHGIADRAPTPNGLVNLTPQGTNHNTYEVNNTLPVITIVHLSDDSTAVTEGDNVGFFLKSTPPFPGSDLSIRIQVADDGTSDFVSSSDEGTRTATIRSLGRGVNFFVSTTPDITDEPNGEVTVTVLADSASPATYIVGTPASATREVNDNDNGAPTVGTAIADQTVATGSVYRYTFPANTFVDGDGDFLLYSSDASGWLTFYGATRTLTGTAPLSATSVDVTVTATDPAGLSVDETFTIAVTDTAPPRIASIERHLPVGSPTSADSLTWRVTFNEPVTGVDHTDFSVTGTGVGSPTVTVAPDSGNAAIYDVTVTGGNLASLNNTVTLVMGNSHGITDGASSPHALVNLTPEGRNENTYAVNNSLPVITISGGSDITEGGLAVFTVTSTPPSSGLSVSLSVTEDEEFVSSFAEGTKSVETGADGTVVYNVRTLNDNRKEANGAVTVTLLGNAAYAVGGGTGSRASVNVADNDTFDFKLRVYGQTVSTYQTKSTSPAEIRLQINGDLTASQSVTIPLTFSGLSSGQYRLSVPAGIQDRVSLSGSTVTVTGPLSASTRNGIYTVLHLTGTGFYGGSARTPRKGTVGLGTISHSGITSSLTVSPLGPMGITIRPSSRHIPLNVWVAGEVDSVADPETTISNSGGRGETNVNEIEEGESYYCWARVDGVAHWGGAKGIQFTYSLGETGAGNFLRNPLRFSFNKGAWYQSSRRSHLPLENLETIDDEVDEPNNVITCRLLRSSRNHYDIGLNGQTVTTIVDNDPTTVTLAGADGNLAEGGSKSFTVTLGRALVAGEILPVPLTFAGTATQGTDYTMTGSTATGVSYENLNGGGVTTVTFTGPSARVATVTIAAASDSESVTETVLIGLGTLNSESGTNLGGGAVGTDNLADFTIPTAVSVPLITISGGADVTEGSNAVFTVTASPVPTAALTVRIQVADDGSSDFVSSSNEGTKTVTIPTGGTVVYNVATEGDSTDEANGVVTVTVLADTADPVTYGVDSPASDTVTVSDDDNVAPTVANSIADQPVLTGAAYSYTVPSNTFEDTDGDDLTYSSNAGSITWLSFNATTRTFSGTAPGTVGTVSVDVTASDGTLSVTDTFIITVSTGDSLAPRIASITRRTPTSSPTGADSLTWRVTFNEPVSGVGASDFSVTGTGLGTPPTVTVLADSGNAIYDVTATGGSLAGFNGTVTLGILSSHGIADLAGTPNSLVNLTPLGTNENTYVLKNIKVTVSGGAAVTEGSNAVFTVTATPAPTSALTVRIQVADDATSDFVSSSNEGTKTVTIATGGTAVYNVATEGDSTDEANGVVTVTVLADTASPVTYEAGSPARDTVTVNDDENVAPTVATAIADQTASVGAAFSYTFPTGTFSDSDGDDLTYTSNAADISWLSFDASTRTFSGTTPSTGSTVSVDVTASDGSLSIKDTFIISVTDNVAPRIASITRRTPTGSPTNADSLTWRVTFNEPVTGVNAGDFSVSGRGLSGSIVSVVADSGNAIYDVTARGGNLATVTATVTLGIVNNHGITDLSPTPNALVNLVPQGTHDNSYAVTNILPVISISGGTGVTEGSNAVFTLRATPAPLSALTVHLQVADDATSDFVSSSNEGTKTVTIPTGGTAVYNVATEGDSTDEANGAVTVKVLAENNMLVTTHTGPATYGVGHSKINVAGAGIATVAVADDDNSAPTVAKAIADQRIAVSATYSYTFPADTFEDADGDSLTYSSPAAGTGDWLTFDAGTRTFSGTAPGTGETVTVTVTASDSALSVTDTFTLTVTSGDVTAPTVVRIARVFSNRVDVTQADILNWQMTFSEAVTGVDATDFIVSGMGLNSPSLTVTVGNNNTYGLEASGGNLADFNGKVILSFAPDQNIQDTAGNPLTPPTEAPTVNNGRLVTLDNSPPVVYIEVLKTHELVPATGQTTVPVRLVRKKFKATLTFEETVNNFDLTDLTITGGTASNLRRSQTDDKVYTVWITPAGASGTVTVQVNADAVFDKLSRGNVATSIELSYDSVAPTLTSIVRQRPSLERVSLDTLTWRLTFSEPVVGLDAGDFRLTGTTAKIASVFIVGAAAPEVEHRRTGRHDNTQWEVRISGGNLERTNGKVTLVLKRDSTITDRFGNRLVAREPTGTNEDFYTLDNRRPRVTISGVPATSSGAFTATFTFSELFVGGGVTRGDLLVTNADVSEFQAVSGANAYTALISPRLSGAVSVTVRDSFASDQAGNLFRAPDDPAVSTYTPPGSLPVITVSGGSPISKGRNAVFTVTATPPPSAPLKVRIRVSDDSTNDFVAGSNEGTKRVKIPTTGSVTYSVATQSGGPADATGKLTVTVLAGKATTATYLPSATEAVDTVNVVDNTAPTIANAIADQPVTIGAAYSYIFPANTFEDADGDSLTYTSNAGSISWLSFDASTRTFSGTAPGTEQTAEVTVTASDGTLSVTDTFTLSVVDTIAPRIISITRLVPTRSPTNADELTWRVTFDEPVTGVGPYDFSYGSDGGGGGLSGVLTTTVTPDSGNAIYDVKVAGASLLEFDGWVRLGLVDAHGITDRAGTPNALSNLTPTGTNDNTYTLDNTPPTVTSITRQTPTSSPTNADELTWRVTFSEAITGFKLGHLTLVQTGLTGYTTTLVPRTGAVDYDVTVSGGNLAEFNGRMLLELATSTSAVEDLVGNVWTDVAPTGTDEREFILDNRAPTVAITGVPETSTAPFDMTVTFSEPVTGFVVGDLTVTGATVSDFSGSGRTYTATLTPTDASVPVTVNVGPDVATDAVGQGNVGAPEVSSTYTPPTVSLASEKLSVRENAGWAEVTLNLSPTHPAAMEIQLNSTSVSATENADYTGGPYRVTLPAKASAVSFRIPIANDGVDELNETFKVTVTAVGLPSGVVLDTDKDTLDLTIVDDDATIVTLTTPDAVATEQDASDTAGIVLTLNRGLSDGETLNIPLNFEGGTLGTDFTLALEGSPSGVSYGSGVVTFTGPSTGSTARVATLKLTAGDDRDSADEKLTVSIPALLTPTGMGGGAVGVRTGEGFITLLDATVDIVAPVVTSIVRETDSRGGATRATTLTWRVTFSEEVMGVDATDFELSGTDAGLTVTGTAERYEVTASGGDLATLSTGTVILSFASGSKITDLTGNVLTETTPTGTFENSFEVDRLAPTVIVTMPSSVRAAFIATLTFSEPVFGFDLEDVTVTGGTASEFIAAGAQAMSWTVQITPEAPGEVTGVTEVTVTVPAGVATDRVNNPNAASLPARSTYSLAPEEPTLAEKAASAFLPRFGRMVGQQSIDAISDRLDASRNAGWSGRLAGRELTGLDASVALSAEAEALARMEELELILSGIEDVDRSRSEPVVLRELVSGTSFALNAGAGEGGSLALWGRGSHSGQQSEENGLELDFEVTGYMLGADWERAGRLLGLMVSQSRGEGDYALGDDHGEMETDLTALIPYFGWKVNRNISGWASLGLGQGELTLSPESTTALSADTDWQMVAGGTRGTLGSVAFLGGAQLGWRTDVFWTRSSSQAVPGLSAVRSDTARLRLALESRWEHRLSSGALWTPRLELGKRYDGGDAEAGYGLEVGGGADWSTPGGLQIGLQGRTLALHQDRHLEDWGLAFNFAYDPRPSTKRGFAAKFSHDFGGASTGGVAGLLDGDLFPGARQSDASARSWLAELAYGFGQGGDRIGSSYTRFGGDRDGFAQMRLGYRIEPPALQSENMTLDLWAAPQIRKERSEGNAAGLQIKGKF